MLPSIGNDYINVWKKRYDLKDLRQLFVKFCYLIGFTIWEFKLKKEKKMIGSYLLALFKDASQRQNEN